MKKMQKLIISLLGLVLVACGGGGENNDVVVDGAPSVEEALGASTSDLEEVALLLAGTYQSTNTVTSNSCSNIDSSAGDVTVETISLFQQDDNLVLTIESSEFSFKGKANGNKFTLIRETSFNMGSCSFEQRVVIGGVKMEDGSLEGNIEGSQTVEGNCGSQKNCETNETFQADPI